MDVLLTVRRSSERRNTQRTDPPVTKGGKEALSVQDSEVHSTEDLDLGLRVKPFDVDRWTTMVKNYLDGADGRRNGALIPRKIDHMVPHQDFVQWPVRITARMRYLLNYCMLVLHMS